jgi:hypothetical protein
MEIVSSSVIVLVGQLVIVHIVCDVIYTRRN